MQLDQIILFGRDLDQYRRMFNLSDADLQCNIVSVADGPATFNREMAEQGRTNVVSADPIYGKSLTDIKTQFQSTFDDFRRQIIEQGDTWNWDLFDGPKEFADKGEAVFNDFLEDFDQRGHLDCYTHASLPDLPFQRKEFNLALCSHLLFAYTHLLSLDFHIRSLRELLRVAEEVRVFPLNDLSFERSEFVDPVVDTLRKEGYKVELEQSDYFDVIEKNFFLRITH
ncbi:Uncharacterised protein [BD1-7 clade bacterium]|uniref:SAM-dependent methyltransferase n=1 Tax=BD1-7 clade bacterium TaxID=2029982 RepID=A0A5S9PN31_9GAMM|nr:Uncharacterised protein [BD1-7 clade bacterium]